MNIEDKVLISQLIDYYGKLLPDSQRNILKLRFNEDLTLNEIAEIEGITRQGVRDSLIRGVKQLYEYEERLKIKDKFNRIRYHINELKRSYDGINDELQKIIGVLEDN
ncbi:MAG: sigma factor-like helix-turn-helix DNA-binding protein [Christensenellales bacterium]|jgi:predicted DNA-binding protein YlxM (UPF0122 family)